jgi:uncharacterized membrane-anchored protein
MIERVESTTWVGDAGFDIYVLFLSNTLLSLSLSLSLSSLIYIYERRERDTHTHTIFKTVKALKYVASIVLSVCHSDVQYLER